MKAALASLKEKSAPLPVRPASTLAHSLPLVESARPVPMDTSDDSTTAIAETKSAIAAEDFGNRMMLLHSRKMRAIQEEQQTLPPQLKQQMQFGAAQFLELKAQYETLDAQLRATNAPPLTSDLQKRIDLYKALEAKRADVSRLEARLKTIEKRDAEVQYTLEAIPYLNHSYKLRAQIEELDLQLRRDPHSAESSKLLHDRLILRAQLEGVCDEYTNKLFPEAAVTAKPKTKVSPLIVAASAAPAVVQKKLRVKQAQIKESYVPPPSECKCGGQFHEVDRDEYVCDSCSNHVSRPADTLPSYNEMKEMAPPQRQYTYRRINHWREFLRQIQGKSRRTIPMTVLTDLQKEFRKCNVPFETLIPKRVRTKLRKMGASKYYEDVEAITHYLNPAYKPIDIPSEREEKLCYMFTQIEGPYERIKKKVKKTRENFQSYSYVFYRFCELLGWTEYLHAPTLLKSPTLLIEQDKWWALICSALGWEYCGRAVDIAVRGDAASLRNSFRSIKQ